MQFYMGAAAREPIFEPKKRQKDAAGGMDNSRDNSIYIFRAIGKFLYNKRWDIRKREARTMDFKELKSYKRKPAFYESH